LRNFSQADLERRTGLARCRISWLENGRAVPTIETLEKISDALGIPVYRLLCNAEEPGITGKPSSKNAINQDKRVRQKNEIPHLSELREHLRRMREEDQRLLLYIARKMAGRADGQPADEGQESGLELAIGGGAGGGNS
jgi:transcriptional regulator with XRE-family HTH domain